MYMPVRVFYDLDTKSTFLVNKEQWDIAIKRFKQQQTTLIDSDTVPIYVVPCFFIETETGIHSKWIFREDQDYCEDHVRGII